MHHPNFPSYCLRHITCANLDTPLTGIDDIAALKRRRLSPLARLALHTARTTLQALPCPKVDYIVWSSAYGDENITANIITDIAHDSTPSPTQFSLSVHNAISGLYSIFYQDSTPAVSLSSPLGSSWTDAVSECVSFLNANHKQNALIVYYDAPLPSIYHTPYPTLDHAFAVGAVVSSDVGDVQQDVQIIASPSPVLSCQNPQAQDFYEWYQSDAPHWQTPFWRFEKRGG